MEQFYPLLFVWSMAIVEPILASVSL